MIRVGICDDDFDTREHLAIVLGRDPGLRVVVKAPSGEAAVAYNGKIDVWLMDVRMHGISGSEACRRIRARDDPPQILMLTGVPDSRVAEALDAGAVGFLYKDVRPAHLCSAIKLAADGVSVSDRSAVDQVLNRPLMSGVDPDTYNNIVRDELDEQIVEWVLDGEPDRAIVQATGLSLSGVKKRLAAMRTRADAGSRPLLMAKLYAARASRDGL